MIKAWILRTIFGITVVTGTAVAPPPPEPLPSPPQIIEVEKPVYITDNAAMDKILSELRSTYEQKIRLLTDRTTQLEQRLSALEKRPAVVEKIVEKTVESPSADFFQMNFSSLDKRIAHLEGIQGYFGSNFIKIKDAVDRFDILDRQVKRLCTWSAFVLVRKPDIHPEDLPHCEGTWW